jgi:hypothetical protein
VLRARRQVAIGGNAQANRHHAGNRAVCGGGASAQRACGDSSTIRVAEDTYVSQGNPNARQASSPSARSRRSHRSHRHPAAVGPDRVLLGVHGPAGPIDLDRGPSPGTTSPRWGHGIDQDRRGSGQYNTFDVTNDIAGNGSYGMVLTTSTTTQIKFTSKESADHPPQLLVTWSTTTPPANDPKVAAAGDIACAPPAASLSSGPAAGATTG